MTLRRCAVRILVAAALVAAALAATGCDGALGRSRKVRPEQIWVTTYDQPWREPLPLELEE